LADKYVLYVGTIQPRKNLRRAIAAFAQANLKGFQFVLVGGHGWLADDIYKAPRDFGVEDKVKFLGYLNQEDLPTLISGAAGLVFPSLYEGFGLPILEAFACECPVLTSRGGATQEVAGGQAILVDAKDTASITTGLKKLVKVRQNDPNLIKKARERSRDFTWERAARETLKVFERVYRS
jgi:glycosyltransferase involved in cell wall biosynthesis